MRLPPFAPVVAALAALFALTSCENVPRIAAQAPAAPAAAGIVSRHGLLRAAGNRIVGRDGAPVSLAGVSYGWSQWEAARFYRPEVVGWLRDDWHAAVIRAPLGVHEEAGYLQDPAANRARVFAVADAAIAADLYVIIDWHDHNAHLHTAEAVAFFQEAARRYGHRPNVIYEIFNEPKKGLTWAEHIKPYAAQVVAAIRAIDPDNLIVVGTPNWSQDVDVATADPLPDPNLAYSIHFYAGTHKERLRAQARTALGRNFALFVTEWGTCNADGNGPVDEASVRAWLDFIRENQLSHCNWGLYDKPETASLVRPSASSRGGWPEADLSPSGKLVRELVRTWPGNQP